MSRRASVFTIPAAKPFVDALAAGVMAGALDIDAADPLALSRVTILVPTRRACRAMAEAFLRLGRGRPMLLPRLVPVGDIDEDALELAAGSAGALAPGLGAAADLPPAIPELRRQMLLTRLILKWGEASSAARRGERLGADQAARLAKELARLLDQVQTERLSFDGLAELVPEDYAAHWQLTLDFLSVVTRHWPGVLAAEGCVDPAERRNLALAAQARAWKAAPPSDAVIAAGTTGTIPATADLLEVIAHLPRGAVVLPGLDQGLDEESWEALDETHPQFAMARLLERLGVARRDVREWASPGVPSGNPARAALVSEALRPAPTTDAWSGFSLERFAEAVEPPLSGVRRIDCPGPREEAGVIALIMREALEEEGKRAALVTPDRGLARRVAAELRRWGVEVDDSAGTELADTPPGAFLRLTAAMVAERFAPVPLLAALKHPLAAGGTSPGAFRARVRAFERAALRGPRPAGGLKGLRAALAAAKLEPGPRRELRRWLDGLARWARPFAAALGRRRVPLSELVSAHVAFAEALAASDEAAGPERLWAGEAGEAAAGFVSELLEAAAGFPPLAGGSYPALFEALMAGRVVRPRYGRHPRLFIWGPLEARLQHVDLMILGGLNEGTWPPEARADPWMSRPMRARFGLPPPERRVGLSAHDFAQAFSAPEVVLTRATRVEGTPSVASRWLLRLENLLREGRKIPSGNRYLHWYTRLDTPQKIEPVRPPAPRPPLTARPRRLSVTEIETLIRDPYAVFARRVLGLEPLDPIDADPGAAERGSFIHRALDRFVRGYPGELPDDAVERLLELGRQAFGEALARPAVRAFWWPRFERIARWFVATERDRRAGGLVPLATEVRGALELPGAEAPFTLSAKADRIDRLPGGGLAILDYKTGSVPSERQVESGLSPQLTLEAAIAAAGGFEGVPPEAVGELAYVRLTGREPAGEMRGLGGDPGALAARARQGLERLVAAYDDPATPYLSRPRPMFARRAGDYDHLARVKEWSSGLAEGE